MKRGIVIPTYNEYNNIARIIPEIFKVDPHVHLIVVDDNSPDGTGEVVLNFRDRYPDQVQLITQEEKNGLGAAYITGMTAAIEEGWDLICEMDADLSHQPKYLTELFKYARTYDLVMGSRYIEGGGVENWPPHRQFLSLFGNIYARTVLGVKLKDMTSGFRCYRRQVLETINLHEVRSNGYSFQIETAYRTWLNGFTIKEVPIIFVEREEGISKINNDIIKEAVTMVWKLRFNRDRLVAPTTTPAPASVQPKPVSSGAVMPGPVILSKSKQRSRKEKLQPAHDD